MESENDDFIRRLGYYEAKVDGTVDLKILEKPADPEVLDEFSTITKVVFDLQPIIFAFQIVENNHKELHGTLESRVNQFNTRTDSALPSVSEFHDSLIVIAQCLINFLGSANSFLDQSQVRIRKVWGEQSQDFVAWDKMRRDLHREHFSFRFLYQLRNFAMHRALPISGLDVQGVRSSPEEPLLINVDVPINRDYLLATSFDWRADVLSEIKQHNEKFGLMELVDDYMLIVARLCWEIIDLQIPRLLECAHYLDAVGKIIKAPPNATPVLWVASRSSKASEPPRRMEVFPFAEFLRIQQIYKKKRPVKPL